jgi:hypothetical protein
LGKTFVAGRRPTGPALNRRYLRDDPWNVRLKLVLKIKAPRIAPEIGGGPGASAKSVIAAFDQSNA